MSASVPSWGAFEQDQILPGVSRTFALTIPQLPPGLRSAITNAYLLCRSADTIEDEVSLTADQKQHFSDRFVAVVEGHDSPLTFASDLVPQLSSATSPAERELIAKLPTVIGITHSFPETQRTAIERCVRLMCEGMPPFQRRASLAGLANMEEMDQYCYYVAGVVGEMLTDLFCAYSPAIEEQRPVLAALSTSFGQGLQMTNIIKDLWADRERGVCWFPRDVFSRAGVDLETLTPGRETQGLTVGLDELIGIAHAHLRNALTYTLAIPRRETGVRRFCLWALGMAILTLRKIYHNGDFLAGRSVKISRRTVRATVVVASLAVGGNWLLTRLFERSEAGLPLAMIRRGPGGGVQKLHDDPVIMV
jgi:farnesyl-diphosphate farnesyltransferase